MEITFSRMHWFGSAIELTLIQSLWKLEARARLTSWMRELWNVRDSMVSGGRAEAEAEIVATPSLDSTL